MKFSLVTVLLSHSILSFANPFLTLPHKVLPRSSGVEECANFRGVWRGNCNNNEVGNFEILELGQRECTEIMFGDNVFPINGVKNQSLNLHGIYSYGTTTIVRWNDDKSGIKFDVTLLLSETNENEEQTTTTNTVFGEMKISEDDPNILIRTKNEVTRVSSLTSGTTNESHEEVCKFHRQN